MGIGMFFILFTAATFFTSLDFLQFSKFGSAARSNRIKRHFGFGCGFWHSGFNRCFAWRINMLISRSFCPAGWRISLGKPFLQSANTRGTFLRCQTIISGRCRWGWRGRCGGGLYRFGYNWFRRWCPTALRCCRSAFAPDFNLNRFARTTN
jgi:hypothetical protein